MVLLKSDFTPHHLSHIVQLCLLPSASNYPKLPFSESSPGLLESIVLLLPFVSGRFHCSLVTFSFPSSSVFPCRQSILFLGQFRNHSSLPSCSSRWSASAQSSLLHTHPLMLPPHFAHSRQSICLESSLLLLKSILILDSLAFLAVSRLDGRLCVR